MLPKEENYALADQMRRAAISIPSNIAEGQQRQSAKEFVRFLYMAKGSCAELETQLLLCVRLGFLNENQITTALRLIDEVSRMISGLLANLQQKLATRHSSLATAANPKITGES